MKPDGKARLSFQIRNALIRGISGMYEYRSLENESRAKSTIGLANKMIRATVTADIPANLDALGVMQPWQAVKMLADVKPRLSVGAETPDA